MREGTKTCRLKDQKNSIDSETDQVSLTNDLVSHPSVVFESEKSDIQVSTSNILISLPTQRIIFIFNL